MDLDKAREAVSEGRVQWRRHVLQRMAERSIMRDEVRATILEGEVIETYDDAWPFPGALLHSENAERSIHAVVSFDADTREVHVVTVYEPDLFHFLPGFRKRRPR